MGMNTQNFYDWGQPRIQCTVCPRRLNPFHIANYNINGVKTSWTDSSNDEAVRQTGQHHGLRPGRVAARRQGALASAQEDQQVSPRSFY